MSQAFTSPDNCHFCSNRASSKKKSTFRISEPATIWGAYFPFWKTGTGSPKPRLVILRGKMVQTQTQHRRYCNSWRKLLYFLPGILCNLVKVSKSERFRCIMVFQWYVLCQFLLIYKKYMTFMTDWIRVSKGSLGHFLPNLLWSKRSSDLEVRCLTWSAVWTSLTLQQTASTDVWTEIMFLHWHETCPCAAWTIYQYLPVQYSNFSGTLPDSRSRCAHSMAKMFEKPQKPWNADSKGCQSYNHLEPF